MWLLKGQQHEGEQEAAGGTGARSPERQAR
jgi:hypothetical protein